MPNNWKVIKVLWAKSFFYDIKITYEKPEAKIYKSVVSAQYAKAINLNVA